MNPTLCNSTSMCQLAVILLMMTTSGAFEARRPQSHPRIRQLMGGQQQRPPTALTAERRPWDAFRFIQQSSRFVSPFPSGATKQQEIQPGDTVWKAGSSENDFTFAPLDDVVMGGASSSNFDGATGNWKGKVTDANNGGFIGIRSTPFVTFDMSKCRGLQLRITPTNKEALRIKVVVRDDTDFNGVGWTTSVNVFPKGSLVKIPFAKQVPTRFAQTVSTEPFAKDQVKGLQLVFSKFEYDGALNPKFRTGDFQVLVEEVQAF